MRLHTTESPQKWPISIKTLMARGPEKRQDSRNVPVGGEGCEAEGPERGSEGKRASLQALVMRQELEKLMFGN